MATPKLNLPTITGNMSADVVRDLNALAQAVDDNAAKANAGVYYGAATGTANVYAVTLSPAPTSYTDGLAIAVKINAQNTAASTINVNTLGAKTIKRANGTDVPSGMLKVGSIYTMRYNSSTQNFILQGEGGSGNAVAADLLSGKTASTDAGDIVGTMMNNGAGGTVTPGTSNQTKAAGYYSSAITVLGDVDLVASNIKQGVDIFGVVGNLAIGKKVAVGSFNPGGGSYYDVTGLTFTPSVIIVFTNSANDPDSQDIILHINRSSYGATAGNTEQVQIRGTDIYRKATGNSTNTSISMITSTGFRIHYLGGSYGNSQMYIAIE